MKKGHKELKKTFLEEELLGIDNRVKWFIGTKSQFIKCIQEGTKMDNPLMNCGFACPLHAGHWVFSNIPDAIPLIHGPAGCINYRQVYIYGTHETMEVISPKNPYTFCTSLTEHDIVMGSEEKLARAIVEIDKEFQPSLIGILNSCVSGIILDDIDGVAQSLQNKVRAKLLPIHTEGFAHRGQGHGYDMVFTELVRHVMQKNERKTPNSVNIWGDFRVGGKTPGDDTFELKNLLAKCGIQVNTVVTGESTVEEIANATRAEFNLPRCFDICLNAAREMERLYGTPYVLETVPFGIECTRDWVLSIAEKFGLIKQVRKMVDAEADKAYKLINPYLGILKGKRAAVMGGPTRAIWQAKFLDELGMEVVLVGTTYIKEDFPDVLLKVLHNLRKEPIVAISPTLYDLEMLFDELKPDIYFGLQSDQRAVGSRGIGFVCPHFPGFFSFEGACRYVREIYNQITDPLRKRLAGAWESILRPFL